MYGNSVTYVASVYTVATLQIMITKEGESWNGESDVPHWLAVINQSFGKCPWSLRRAA